MKPCADDPVKYDEEQELIHISCRVIGEVINLVNV
jgi:hypothetical protein